MSNNKTLPDDGVQKLSSSTDSIVGSVLAISEQSLQAALHSAGLDLPERERVVNNYRANVEKTLKDLRGKRMSENSNGLSSLGLEIGDGNFSELTVEAQASEAFARFNHKVPDELMDKFMNAATCAVRRAAASVNDPKDIDVDDLIHRFEGILRELMNGNSSYG